MGRAKRAHPLCAHLAPRRAAVRARLQRHLDSYIHCTPAVRIPTVIEKVQLAKFGFDLCHGHRGDVWMPSQVIPQRVAKCQEDVLPAWATVDFIDVRVREQLRIALTELSNLDLG